MAVANLALVWLLCLMAMGVGARAAVEEFDAFFRVAEPRLRSALIAGYGPVAGREAAVDALSWAWQHWDRLQSVENRIGYLYRVGQSAVRRNAPGGLRVVTAAVADEGVRDVEPALVPALARLSDQQRTVAVLVHGYGWSQTDVAELLGVNVSTVREHLSRALIHLRASLGVDRVG